jgi:hypothetical protein
MTSLTSAAEGASDLRPGSCGGNLYWFHTASSPKERASPAIKLDPLWFANRTLQSRLIACSSFFSVQFVKYISVPNHGRCLGSAYRHSEQAIISGIMPTRLSETLMPRPSNKMRELRTALAVALGLAIASFGAAVVAAGYITK